MLTTTGFYFFVVLFKHYFLRHYLHVFFFKLFMIEFDKLAGNVEPLFRRHRALRWSTTASG